MKIKQTTIPTPPKGHQTMFQVWLVSWEPQYGDEAYFFYGPDESILANDLMYVDDNDSIHYISEGSHAIHFKREGWKWCIADKIDAHNDLTETVLFEVDSKAVALEIPTMANGVRWHIVTNPKMALRVLAFEKNLSHAKQEIFLGLFDLYFKGGRAMFQTMKPNTDVVKDCQWHTAHFWKDIQ